MFERERASEHFHFVCEPSGKESASLSFPPSCVHSCLNKFESFKLKLSGEHSARGHSVGVEEATDRKLAFNV